MWHYKCIRPILNGPTWPNFLCPNCRAVTDLEADVDEPQMWEDDFEIDENEDPKGKTPAAETDSDGAPHLTPQASHNDLAEASRTANARISEEELAAAMDGVCIRDPLINPPSDHSTPQRTALSAATPSTAISQPVAIVSPSAGQNDSSSLFPTISTPNGRLSSERPSDCPMTPRNDAGPFVLDGQGSSGRASGGSRSEDGVATEAVTPSRTMST